MLNRLTILVLLGTLATSSLLVLRAETPAAPEKKAVQQNIDPKGQQQLGTQQESQNAKATEVLKSETQEDLKIQRELANYTWWLAAATVLLVVVGAGQVLLLIRQERILHGALNEIHAQAEQMKIQTGVLEKSVAAAQKSADAAKISADVAAGLSVPTLVIHEFGVGNVGAATVEAFFQIPKIKITVKNYGQTPAILKWFSICCTCEELPDVPVYEGPGCGIVLEKIVVQPGAEYTLPNLMYLQREEFSSEDVRAIINREKLFCAYGYICYGDILGNPLRRLKFCETVLNIFGDDETICDWHGEIGPAAYTGTDHFPAREPKQQESNPN